MKILIIDENGVKEFYPSEVGNSMITAQESSLSQPESEPFKDVSKENLKLYTFADLIELFNTSRPNLYKWVKEGLLKPISLGGRKYFRATDIEQMLNENMEG